MNKSTVLLFILLAVILVSSVWIADIDPMPDYCEDCLPPLKVEIMDTRELYLTTVILSMLIVNIGLAYLMYRNAKNADKTIRFDMSYMIYALLGVIIGFQTFVPMMKFEGTYIEIFFAAAMFAIAGEGLVNKGRKAYEAQRRAKEKEEQV